MDLGREMGGGLHQFIDTPMVEGALGYRGKFSTDRSALPGDTTDLFYSNWFYLPKTDEEP